MGEVPLYGGSRKNLKELQGYLAHKKTPNPPRPPQDPKHRPTAESLGGAFSYGQGTPVQLYGGSSKNPQELHRADKPGHVQPSGQAYTYSCVQSAHDLSLKGYLAHKKSPTPL